VAGETAGTSIRSVLQRISKLDKHFEKLRKQGIDININLKDFYDEKGAFKLEEFLMVIRKELSAIQDPLQRMQVIKELFDMEGMRAIAPLLAATKEEALMYLEEIRKSIEATHDPRKIAEFREQYEQLRKQIEAEGFTGLEKMAKELDNQASLQQRLNRLMNTYANVLEAVEGTLANLMAVIGSLVAPALIAMLNPLNDLLGKLADFIQENRTVARVLTLTVGGFVGFLAIVGTVSLAVASFMKLFSLAFAPVKWLLAVSAVGKLALALKAFSIALLISPIGWIALAVGALIGVGYLLWKQWDTVSKGLAKAWNWLKSSWQKVLEVLINIHPIFALFNALNKLVQYVFGIDLFTAGKKIVESLWKGIESLAMKPVEAMKNIVQKIRNLLPSSPAKEGPLRDIHRIKLIETIAAGLNADPILTRMKDIAIKVSQFAPAVGLRLALAGSTTITVNIGPIQVYGTEGGKVAQSIASDLEREIRRVLAKIENERYRRSY
jgi:DNA-binding protein H-NS